MPHKKDKAGQMAATTVTTSHADTTPAANATPAAPAMNTANANTDPVFTAEQEHLSHVYEKLLHIEAEQLSKVSSIAQGAHDDKADMAEELTIDLADFDSTLETLANIESLNRIVDSYNLASQTAEERLDRTRLLLRQPYFAKVTLQLSPDRPPRDIYLGVCGMNDETGRLFIVDWRAPVAETYYNQSMGPTSYKVDGRTVHVDLLLRRQFEIERDELRAYFDTTVAIEDPLLLRALTRSHSSKMQAITTTIQREQNTVIRHADVPALLVRGIAGSGKTSVLLQRIAYLLYQNRATLRPDQLHLITPNDVFSRYISDVLPSMGEHNPQTDTWQSIAARWGISPDDRGIGANTVERLREIDEACRNARLAPEDCRALRWKDDVIIPAPDIAKIAARFGRVQSSRRQCECVNEELHDRLDQMIQSEATSESVRYAIDEMEIEEQCRLFGHPVDTDDKDEVREAGLIFLEEKYAAAHKAVDNASWISTRRLSKRILGGRGLKPIERTYLRLLFSGAGDAEARYVLIDEVQDYTTAQLMLLTQLYPHAHFLLLGDPNQAIYEGCASFEEIFAIFEQARGRGNVSSCALLTSYRSTPEITALFAPLADEQDRIAIDSVRRAGTPVAIHECHEQGVYENALASAIRETAQQLADGASSLSGDSSNGATNAAAGIGAVIASTEDEAGRIAARFDLPLVSAQSQLPEKGLAVMSLPFAKGLEFDAVIIPDASAAIYGADERSRRRLYTAISRATSRITILSNGKLSPLLHRG